MQIDPNELRDTGEIKIIGSPVWAVSPKGAFEIVRPKELLPLLEKLGVTDIRVLCHLMRYKNKSNHVLGTQNMISKRLGMHPNATSRSIRKLRKLGAIKKTDGGFMVNPSVMMKGDKNMARWIYGEYMKIIDKEAPDCGEEDVGQP